MNLIEFSPQKNDSYHFETSDSYCAIEKIVYAEVTSISQSTTSSERLQLESIVGLEKARYQYGIGVIDFGEYKVKVESIVKDCRYSTNDDPFAPTIIHQQFYRNLNRVYNES